MVVSCVTLFRLFPAEKILYFLTLFPLTANSFLVINEIANIFVWICLPSPRCRDAQIAHPHCNRATRCGGNPAQKGLIRIPLSKKPSSTVWRHRTHCILSDRRACQTGLQRDAVCLRRLGDDGTPLHKLGMVFFMDS